MYGYGRNSPFQGYDYLGQFWSSLNFGNSVFSPLYDSGNAQGQEDDLPDPEPNNNVKVGKIAEKELIASPGIVCGGSFEAKSTYRKMKKFGISSELSTSVDASADYLAAQITASVGITAGLNYETEWSVEDTFTQTIPGPEGAKGKKRCWCIYQTVKYFKIGGLKIEYQRVQGFDPVDNGLFSYSEECPECPDPK